MTTRTTRSVVRFAAPFLLKGIEGPLRPGDYAVDQDEEAVEGVSWLAYRRVAAFIHLPALGANGSTAQMVAIDHADLEAALRRDREDI